MEIEDYIFDVCRLLQSDTELTRVQIKLLGDKLSLMFWQLNMLIGTLLIISFQLSKLNKELKSKKQTNDTLTH